MYVFMDEDLEPFFFCAEISYKYTNSQRKKIFAFI